MKVTSRNHIHHYVPNYLHNRHLTKAEAGEQIVVRLRVITALEEDSYQREALENARTYALDKAQELNEARLTKLFKEKFVGVDNLEIEGFEGKELDFDTFYAEAPPEIVNEVLRAIRSKEVLTLGEQKNFLPESDGL